MRFARNIRQRTRGALGPALCLCALAYFGYHAVQGNYGLLALKDLERQRAELEVRATTSRSESWARLFNRSSVRPSAK